MLLLGLAGYAQSGKDSAADFLQVDGWHRVSFAAPLRAMAETIDPIVGWSDGPVSYVQAVKTLGYDEAKRAYPMVREFLQKLGQAAREELGRSIWVDTLFAGLGDYEKVVVTDVRHQEELHSIWDRDGKVVYIERPGVGPVNAHVSETAIEGARFDAVIQNDASFETLAKRIRDTVRGFWGNL
jgi:dephospho-CoA kinase